MTKEADGRLADALSETLGFAGRMISFSKSGYRDRHADHVPVFNANVCTDGGKIWWGDLDLTLDEPQLTRLSERIGETVYVLYEGDGRFEHEQQPLIDRAVYSVTPTGHNSYDHRHIERAPDGSLRLRPPPPETRRRWRWAVLRHRPRLLRFWQLERNRAPLNRTRRDEMIDLLYVGARDGGATPLLVLGLLYGRRLRAFGLECTWYPSKNDSEWRAAPRPLLSLRSTIRLGPLQLWFRLVVWPGLTYELVAGYRATRNLGW